MPFRVDTKRKALEQLALAARRLRGPHQFITTGMGDFGRWTHEAEQVKYVDVVSFHSYDGNQTDMRGGIASVRKLAESSHKQLAFASEIMNRPWDPVPPASLHPLRASLLYAPLALRFDQGDGWQTHWALPRERWRLTTALH
eukprot:COSAG06_NODE_1826_length_8276_cov_139.732053_10_plen_142_part_00